MLAPLTSWLQYSLPSSLEVIHLLYYCASREQQTLPDFIEDAHVGLLLDNREIPNLKEIAVPSFPHDISGRAYTSSRQLECWNRSREILKSNEIFKDGKVKLRLLHLGEAGECVVAIQIWFVRCSQESKLNHLVLNFLLDLIQSATLRKERSAIQTSIMSRFLLLSGSSIESSTNSDGNHRRKWERSQPPLFAWES